LATCGIYFSAFFFRIFKTWYNGVGLPAYLQTLPDGLLKLEITVPPRVKWTPGQHFIIRFLNLGIHAFSSHPFTVTSIANKESGDNKLQVIFAAQGGITRRLKDVVNGRPSKAFKVWVDGPYGGPPVSMSQYDHVYLMAGGSGESYFTYAG
jgi:predicted ferric reductase